MTSQWASNHRQLDGLFNYSIWPISKKHQSPALLALCEGNSPVTGEFPAQRASNAEKASIWWRHHALNKLCSERSKFGKPLVSLLFLVSSSPGKPFLRDYKYRSYNTLTMCQECTEEHRPQAFVYTVKNIISVTFLVRRDHNIIYERLEFTWRRPAMETLPVLLAHFDGNPAVSGIYLS